MCCFPPVGPFEPRFLRAPDPGGCFGGTLHAAERLCAQLQATGCGLGAKQYVNQTVSRSFV